MEQNSIPNELYGMPGHVIRRLNQRSSQIFNAKVQEAGFDLTSVQYAALDALRQNPGIDQAHLSSLIAYDRATIGGVVERLENKGLVTRRVSKRDRRAREVYLSPKGEKTFAEMYPIVASLQTDILAGLTDAEREDFLTLIRKVLAGSPETSLAET